MSIQYYKTMADLEDFAVQVKVGPTIHDYVAGTFRTAFERDCFDYHWDDKLNRERLMLFPGWNSAERGKHIRYRIKVAKQWVIANVQGPQTGYEGDLETTDEYAEFSAGIGWDGSGFPPPLFWSTDDNNPNIGAGIWRRYWDSPDHSQWHDVWQRDEFGYLSHAELQTELQAVTATLHSVLRDDVVDCELVRPNFRSQVTVETNQKPVADPVILPRGEWDVEAEYNVNDSVTRLGDTYYCRIRNKATSPSNALYWTADKPEGFRETDLRSQMFCAYKNPYGIYLFEDGLGAYSFWNPKTYVPPTVHDYTYRNSLYRDPGVMGNEYDTYDPGIPLLGKGQSSHSNAPWTGAPLIAQIANDDFTAAFIVNVSGYDLNLTGTGEVVV